jgi:hypothetical protein
MKTIKDIDKEIDVFLQLPEGFSELILEWLKYKAEKRQSYKQKRYTHRSRPQDP